MPYLWLDCGNFDFQLVEGINVAPKDSVDDINVDLNKGAQVEIEELVIMNTVYAPYPVTFFTDDMEVAWRRFKKTRIGIGDSIQAAFYYVLTLIIQSGGNNKKEAVKILNVDFKVCGIKEKEFSYMLYVSKKRSIIKFFGYRSKNFGIS